MVFVSGAWIGESLVCVFVGLLAVPLEPRYHLTRLLIAPRPHQRVILLDQHLVDHPSELFTHPGLWPKQFGVNLGIILKALSLAVAALTPRFEVPVVETGGEGEGPGQCRQADTLGCSGNQVRAGLEADK